MTVTSLPLTASKQTSAFATWCKQGAQLFLKSPFTLFGICLLIMIAGSMFQMLPAPYGVITSKLVAPLIAAIIWIVIDQVQQHGKFSFAAFKAYPSYRKLPLLAFVLILPAVCQLLAASLILGAQGLNLILFADIVGVSAMQVAMIFAAAAPAMVFTMFAPAFLLLKNTSVLDSIQNGFKIVLSAYKPMLALTILNAIVLFAAPFTIALSVVFLGPWLACVGYVAFMQLAPQQASIERLKA